ncbi:MAG TPA: O-antigen ligase family protein [Mesotoga infera]|uniref:O-antigen ligase family protein n=1 Tax=Mesotoga infera TaxID=1236046 RepID=A0A7C1CU43_9BACT|nr:O-antigen ligase family protein [Mesotoga infera]
MTEKKHLIDFETLVYLILTLFIPLFVTKGFTHEPSTGKHLFYVVGFAIIFLSMVLKKKEISIEFGFVHLAFFGIGIAALLSLIVVSIDNPQYFRYSLEIALYIVFLSFTAVYISNKWDTVEKIEIVMLFFVIGAAVVAIDALLNFYLGYDIFLGKVGEPFARASARSTIGNPNFVSDYMGMTIPMIFYFIISRKPLGLLLKKPSGQLILKSVMVTFLVPMVASVFVSQTRTVITAIFFGNLLFLLLYFFLRRGKRPEPLDDNESKRFKRLSLVFLLIALIIIAVLSYMYLTPSPLSGEGRINITARLEYALTSSGSWNERFSAWYNSVFQWLDDSNKLRIPFGSGIGTFQLYHLLYSPQVLEHNPDYMLVWNNFKRTHNDYVQGLGEMGIIGLLFIVLMVGLLVFRYVKNLFRIDNKKDLLLYGSLGAGIFSLAVHSFFEFPLHMQPNLMLAIFLGSVAVGKYFNPDLKKKKASKTLTTVLLFALAASLIFLKTTAFLGEGFFRTGQTNQQYYLAYFNQAQSLNLNALQQAKSEIANSTGNYSYLADVSSYMNVKGTEIRSKYPGANQIELLEQAEKERQNEIRRLTDEVDNRINQYNFYISRSAEYYEQAIADFKLSNRLYPVFGKPLWYIAGLGTKAQRLETARDNSELMKSILTGKDEYSSDIILEFKGDPEIIPVHRTSIRTLPFAEFFEKHASVFDDPELVSDLQLYFITQIQMILDAADYYESSTILFSERQTPRILGRLYTSINSELKKYYNFINSRESVINSAFGESEEFRQIIIDLVYESSNRATYWFDLGIHLLPGTWNRYPDWEDIYIEYLNSIPSILDTVEERKLKILSIAGKHVWACENMGPATPDETLQFAVQWGKSNLSGEELSSFEQNLKDVFERVVNLNRDLIEKSPNLPENTVDQIQSLISLFETL